MPRCDDDVRVLWFTVEGVPPYLEVTEAADLEKLQFRETFRADWLALPYGLRERIQAVIAECEPGG